MAAMRLQLNGNLERDGEICDGVPAISMNYNYNHHSGSVRETGCIYRKASKMADKLVMGYWDCPFCNTVGIEGTVRSCPNCGKPRGEDTKFYMKAHSHEEVVSSGAYLSDSQAKGKGQGEDWKCSYCGGLNSTLDAICTSCGHARDEHDETYHEMRERRDARNTASAPSAPQRTGSSSRLKMLLVALGVILALSAIMAFVSAPRDHMFTVTGKSWEYTTEIQEQLYVDESDWSLPAGADLVSQAEEVHHFDQVIDHFETRERSYQERVQTGSHTEYSYHDNGDGTFTEVAHTVPDYGYETRYETYEEPVYVSIPVFQTKYYYKIWRWKYKTTIVNAGDADDEPSFGDGIDNLGERERIGQQTQQYWVEGYIDDKSDKTRIIEVGSDVYDRYQPGDAVPITTDLTLNEIYDIG